MSISTAKKSGHGKQGKTGKLPSPLSVSNRKPANDRRDAFVVAYTASHNATLSAIEAGYSPKTAYSQGSRLLKDAELQKRIQQYGQLGLDILAKIAYEDEYNELARVNAAKELVNRSYGMPKANDKAVMGNIVINYNKIHIDSDKELRDHPTTPGMDVVDVPSAAESS